MKRMVLAALVVALLIGAVMCGGTTGNEDLPPTPAPKVVTVDGGLDATIDSTVGDPAPDADFFDVDILYADRVIPDVAAPVMMTGDAGAEYPWPSCPPWVAVNHGGRPVAINEQYTTIPALYGDAGDPLVDDAGRVVPYPDGSACATYPWLGTSAADTCVASAGEVQDYPPFPPCSWCIDAGVTRQGPLAGHDRYEVCLQLYSCIVRTGCAEQSSSACLCGSDQNTSHCDAGGACGTEELASLESLSDPGSIATALANYTGIDPNPQTPGNCARVLNAVFTAALNNQCFPDAGP